MAIEAAGGLVWRETPEGRRLAVIFRTKHRDWTLPKGKKEPDESMEQAALREVREETGYAAELGAEAGTIEYAVRGVPKIVRYWHMRASERVGEPKRGEVDRVEWLSVDQAVDRLDREDERDLVRQVAGARGGLE